ncbi:MAG: hypothetical protein WB764_04955 [Xanthobacteraceae bacterium]
MRDRWRAFGIPNPASPSMYLTIAVKSSVAALWDVHVDDLIPSRGYHRVHYGEA